MTANDNKPPRRPDEPNRRGTVAALVAVVAIGLALFWAMSAIRAHNAGLHRFRTPRLRRRRWGVSPAATPSRSRHHVHGRWRPADMRRALLARRNRGEERG